MNYTKKSIFWGTVAGLLLLVFYFLVLSLANSFFHAWQQFSQFWYWILVLIIGFGFQVGLYVYIRQRVRERKLRSASSKELAATAGVSTTSMIACCAHHLIDVLPILGASAVFLFLAKYQEYFLFLGVVSNLVGILFMLEIIKKHSLFQETSWLSRISQLNLKRFRKLTIAVVSLFFLVAFFRVIFDDFEVKLDVTAKRKPVQSTLSSVINDEGGLSIEIQPLNISYDEPVRFEISLNTHQGDLDFDLTQKATLSDDKNNQYLPLEWQGGQGGHHLSGILVFPALQKETTFLKLIIKDLYGIKEREFLWSLN